MTTTRLTPLRRDRQSGPVEAGRARDTLKCANRISPFLRSRRGCSKILAQQGQRAACRAAIVISRIALDQARNCRRYRQPFERDRIQVDIELAERMGKGKRVPERYEAVRPSCLFYHIYRARAVSQVNP